MSGPGVVLAVQSRIATITIDRPAARNKVDTSALRAIAGHLVTAQRESGVRAVVLTGRGDAFCTGGEQTGYPERFEVEDRLEYSRAYIDLLTMMGRCPLPVIARVNGDCLAGGTMLLARCDLAVAVDTAAFGLPELESGGFPMMALATGLEQIPSKMIFDMAYLGRRISAADALRLNLVNRVCAAADLDAEIDTMISTIVSRNPGAIAFGRRSFYAMRSLVTSPRLETSQYELMAMLSSARVRSPQ